MGLTRIVTPFLIAIAFCTSFFFHGGYDIAYAPALLCLFLAGLICVLPELRRTITLPRHACIFFTLAFWAYLSLSLIWTTVPYASLVTWINLTALPLVLIILLSSRNKTEIIRNTLILLIAATCIAACYNLWQFFVEGNERSPGIFPNPNNTAALFNLSLLPALAFWMSGEKKYRPIAAGLCILLFMALVTTGSRGGLLCAIAGMLMIGVTLRHSLISSWKNTVLIIVIMLSVFAGFYFFTESSLFERIATFGEPVADFSTHERIAIWKGALLILKDHLLTGTGLGTFYLYYPAYRLESDHFSLGHWAHLDALQFGAETGILAVFLFYAAVISWFAHGTGALRRMDLNDPRRIPVAGCMAGLLALTLHAHIEFQFYILANLIMAGTLMAALYHLTATAEDKSYAILSFRKNESYICMASLLIVTGLVCITIISAASGIRYLNKAQNELDRGSLEGFVNNIALSRQWSPRSFADADVRLAGFYFDLLANPGGQMTPDDRKQTYLDALSLLNDAAKVNPAWADIDHKRAKLHARIGAEIQPNGKELAIDSWKIALKKNPTHLHAREEFTRYLLRHGRVDEAYAVINEGMNRPMTRQARTIFTELKKQIEPLVAAKNQYQAPSTP